MKILKYISLTLVLATLLGIAFFPEYQVAFTWAMALFCLALLIADVCSPQECPLKELIDKEEGL